MNDIQPIVLAVIPARGGSKGIPRKNLEIIGLKPLVAHSIGHALNAKTIDAVVVTSEDKEIQEVSKSFGAEVLIRPKKYAADTSRVDPLLIATVRQWEEQNESKVEILVLLYPTAPLRDVESIDKAVRLVQKQGYDSALSLCFDTSYIWKRKEDIVSPVNYDPKKRMPRQKEVWNQWIENKAIYVMKRKLLFDTGCRLGGKIGFVEMPKWRSIDVDSPEDLFLARMIYQQKFMSKI
jgi:CMP-N,N'-diacetyllegionaminic acid synthase